MFVAISVLIILISIILGLVVLVQNSKGGGLASGFSSSTQIMGVRKTTDLLEKLTWGFGIAMFLFCLIASVTIPKRTTTTNQSNQESIIQDQLDNSVTPPQALPQAPPPSAGTTAE